MTQQDKDRQAFEKAFWDNKLPDYPLAWHCAEVMWKAARDYYAPRLDEVRVCGLSALEIARLHDWFQAQGGRTFASFWEEAFDAGVTQAKIILAPQLTEKEASESAAAEFCKSTDVFDPPAMSAALRAAGMRFKEEA